MLVVHVVNIVGGEMQILVRIVIVCALIAVRFAQCQLESPPSTNTTHGETVFSESPRGGYGGGGGGGYGGGGYGGGGYGGGGYGGGGHHHAAIATDPVSILGLLSLGAILLRSILNLLNTSARSLDVADMNLPLMMSDIPERIQSWQQTMASQHTAHERSLDGYPSSGDFLDYYLAMMHTRTDCIPKLLCGYWNGRIVNSEDFTDLYMLATARWLGSVESATLYDQVKKPGGQEECLRASDRCTTA